MSAAVSMPVERVHLQTLSNSAIACYRRCPREFRHRYVKLRRPRRSSEALRFGTFFHVALNAWWGTAGSAEDKLFAAIAAMRARAETKPEDADPFELVKAEELMIGYTVRWGDEAFETLAVEQVFEVPLVNPETGRASKTYRVTGAIDAIARRPGSTKTIQVEHKTTSDDIGAGEMYWATITALDPQVSTYQSAMRALGYQDVETLYDVIRKVGLIPSKATPEDKRKYTQEKSKACPFCKKTANVPGPHRVSAEGEPEAFCVGGRIITEAGGVLYKGQREADETPEEFRERVHAAIAEDPQRYYARGPVVRLEHDEREHASDVWMTAAMVRMSENAGAFPRSPTSCKRFHRLCEYFDVCAGQASIDDENRFRTAETVHEELRKEV